MTHPCGTRSFLLALPVLLGLLIACESPASGDPDAGLARDAALVRDGASPGDASVLLDGASADASVDAAAAVDGASPPPDAGPSALERARMLLESPTANAAALDALIYEVSWGEGWPLRDRERWLFATRWDGAPANVALVGDINEWNTSAARATRAASGVHYFVILDPTSFTSPAVGAKYKWYGAGDVYRAPPESRAYGFDEFGEFGWVRPPTDAPHLERFPAHRSAFLTDTRAFRAYLPAGFVPHSMASARARTLLLHDGQNVFHPNAFFGGWGVDEALEGGPYGDVVALAIDNAPDRMSAYTHVADTIGGGPTGGQADAYMRLVMEEALPFFRAQYGVQATGDSLAIAGSSLGGLVAMYGALSHPELAGCVAALSPTLGWGAFAPGAREALVLRWPTPGHLSFAVYLDSGGGGTCRDTDGDGVQEDSDDSDNFCVTRQLHDLLAARGYVADTDLHYRHTPGAPHNEASWRARFPGVLSACTSSGWNAE